VVGLIVRRSFYSGIQAVSMRAFALDVPPGCGGRVGWRAPFSEVTAEA
jgi:hypothetical protein